MDALSLNLCRELIHRDEALGREQRRYLDDIQQQLEQVRMMRAHVTFIQDERDSIRVVLSRAQIELGPGAVEAEAQAAPAQEREAA